MVPCIHATRICRVRQMWKRVLCISWEHVVLIFLLLVSLLTMVMLLTMVVPPLCKLGPRKFCRDLLVAVVRLRSHLLAGAANSYVHQTFLLQQQPAYVTACYCFVIVLRRLDRSRYAALSCCCCGDLRRSSFRRLDSNRYAALSSRCWGDHAVFNVQRGLSHSSSFVRAAVPWALLRKYIVLLSQEALLLCGCT